MKTTVVTAFLVGVVYPPKRPGGQPVAWLELQDDADCHPYRVGVPYKFARIAAAKLEENEGEDTQPIVTLTIAIVEPDNDTR